jgi:ABC-type Fe3+/spermidine/putrescine transport system ATPase subunit
MTGASLPLARRATCISGPGTLWSAEFLGDVNRCGIAQITTGAGGHCTVVTDTGMRLRARLADNLPQSSACALVIRPEDCRVSMQKPEGREAFAATIVGTAFLARSSGCMYGWIRDGRSPRFDPGDRSRMIRHDHLVRLG